MFVITLLNCLTHREILPEKLYGAKIVQHFDKAKKNHEKHRGGVPVRQEARSLLRAHQMPRYFSLSFLGGSIPSLLMCGLLVL